jgi:prepilin-type N-terminal cleavage/methylation domain-containing protein
VSERPGPPPASRPQGRRGPARGFTILELLVALVAVTLISALSMWAYFARPEVTLDNATLLLARDMRIAQNRAVLLRRPVYLAFAKDGDGYRVYDDSDDDAPPSRQGFERVERHYGRDAIFQGVRILHFGLATLDRITFPPDGREPPAGRIMLSYGDETRTLEIEVGTGRILLADRASGRNAWDL